MRVPRYIKKELEGIDSLYFTIFNHCVKGGMSNGRGRWQIRKWIGSYPRRLDLWDTDMSEVILTICKETVTEDDGLIDAGYQEMDMRVVTAIRESSYWRADWKKKIEKIDWNNEQLERKAKEQLEYEARYMAKSIWRKYKEPTVLLSGKEWKI